MVVQSYVVENKRGGREQGVARLGGGHLTLSLLIG